MKRKLLILFGTIAVLAIAAVGASAAFTAQADTVTEITAGTVDITVLTTGTDLNAVEGEEATTETAILPGSVVDDALTVKNTGTAPAYIRVKLTKSVKDSELSAEDCMDLDIDTKNWTEQDGWYYYNKILEPDAETEPLFTKIEFKGSEIGNAYLGKTFVLDTAARAVQSANNDPAEAGDVTTVTGWPAETP